jgi:hypothetical protein
VQAHDSGEVDVGLDVLASRDVPPAALDQPPHPLDELRVDPLHLLEEPGFPAGSRCSRAGTMLEQRSKIYAVIGG